MQSGRGQAGFTLIELVVVLFILGLLAAIAVPAVSGSIHRAREAALVENLAVMRRAIDSYYGDQGGYPDTLAVLADARYISFVPQDPLADDGAGWIVVNDQEFGGIRDVRSTADGVGTNGVAYREW